MLRQMVWHPMVARGKRCLGSFWCGQRYPRDRWWPTLLFLGLWLLPAVSVAEFPTRELWIGELRLELEIAATPRARSQGLMFRRSMPANHGMLFVWDHDDQHAMWMRNTYLPLSVAFVDSAFRIVNIADMEPLTTQLHHSRGPVRFAIEVHQGWFDRHGIRPGMQLEDLPRLLADLRLP